MKKQFIITTIAMLICGCIYAQSETVYGNNPANGRYLKTRGFNMYYEIYGTGKPLLIIHGNGQSIKNFSKQISYFENR